MLTNGLYLKSRYFLSYIVFSGPEKKQQLIEGPATYGRATYSKTYCNESLRFWIYNNQENWCGRLI